MSEHTWWYLARSSGIAAMVLLVGSVVWGVLLATRVLRPHDRPAWLLDLHRWLGGVALVMTALHLTGLVLDGYVQFGPRELLVPGASDYRPLAVALGILSMYLLVAVEVTSYLRRRLPARLWKGVHLTSYLLLWTAAVHAGLAGTDVENRVYQAVAVVLTMVAVAAGLVRVLDGGGRPSRDQTASRSRAPVSLDG
jgi:DMSO/TMAO reductase YedYZ heme-binding membrane subunit